MTLVLHPSVRQDILRRRRQTPDKRIAQRLCAVLWIADGRSSRQVADLLGVNPRQVRKWLRLFRTQGLEALCTLHYQGGTGRLRPAQIERLKQEVATGRFLAARQIADWIAQTFHVAYTARGVRNLLHRIGASYHKATGFFWKADPDKQDAFLRKYESGTKARQTGRKRGDTSWTLAIRSGAWRCSTAAGCWSGSGCWWASAGAASG